MEFPLESVDEESHKRLLSARDCYGNTFEIKRDGRHAFYDNDTYDTKKCPQCNREQEHFEARNYGERHVVLNRDYSGGFNDTDVRIRLQKFKTFVNRL